MTRPAISVLDEQGEVICRRSGLPTADCHSCIENFQACDADCGTLPDLTAVRALEANRLVECRCGTVERRRFMSEVAGGLRCEGCVQGLRDDPSNYTTSGEG